MITLLLSSVVYANTSDKIEDFLSGKFANNKDLKSVDVEVDSVVPLQELKGWNAYIVVVKAVLKSKPKQQIKQKMIWFSNGTVITKEMTDLQSGTNFTEIAKPNFKLKYYNKENLVYGNANAKHKVVIFSDPLCPFCRKFAPVALKYMKKYPKMYAVYYYHLPLKRLHPASISLVRMAQVAQNKGVKDVLIKMYKMTIDPQKKAINKFYINPNERDVNTILSVFNKAVGTKIKLSEIKTKKVEEQIQFDAKVANDIMVGGTPTIYIDGKIDRSKNKYKKVK